MEAKNFRIGNYIESKEWGGFGAIEGIEITKEGFELKVKGHVHKFTNDGKTYFDLQPIEITPKRLEDFGFNRFEDKGVVGLDYSEPDEMTIWYGKGKFTIVQFGENTPFIYSNQWLRIELKYIHELQNLFFALTGRELEMKVERSTYG